MIIFTEHLAHASGRLRWSLISFFLKRNEERKPSGRDVRCRAACRGLPFNLVLPLL